MFWILEQFYKQNRRWWRVLF